MLLTTGEQISVSLMAMAFHKLGIPAVSLNAFQVKMHSTSTYGNARFKKVESERILHELGYRKIVIVTGFQGVNKYEDYATMGRGGSDTTAVAIAAALGADACEIYTDVDGVYTADPRIVPSARKLKEISYDEMQELASMGANVLHNRSVEMAKKYGVQLVVRSSMNREEGTVVKEVVKVEKLLISGVASDKNTARISVIGIEDKPGTAFKIFNTLAKKNINVDIILQSVGRDGTKDISFTVAEDCLLYTSYVTNNELGFDYLRDNMVIYKEQLVQRGLNFAVIDEVDSVLIDEARTPLIISGQSNKSTKLYEACDILARQLERGEASGEFSKINAIMGEDIEESGDFIVNEKEKVVNLTEDGVKKVENFFHIENLADPENLEIQHNIILALRAHNLRCV